MKVILRVHGETFCEKSLFVSWHRDEKKRCARLPWEILHSLSRGIITLRKYIDG